MRVLLGMILGALLLVAGVYGYDAISTSTVAGGEVLLLQLASGVLITAILSLPQRRGPAPKAHEFYRVFDERSPNPIAGEFERQDRQKDPPL